LGTGLVPRALEQSWRTSVAGKTRAYPLAFTLRVSVGHMNRLVDVI
jgi:hypothetical protein